MIETPSLTEALQNFVVYFKNDLTSFIRNRHIRNRFRCVVMGGYGLKTVLEHKYGLHNKVKTRDLDITVSSYKSEYNQEQLLDYWLTRLVAFIRQQPNPKDYKVSVIQGSMYVPIMDYTRTAIIMISYKYQDFVDVAITNAKIAKVSIDKATSIKTGLPIKNLNEYLLELLSIIYRSNVQDVAPEVYVKRNPVTGYQSEKGLNDIERAKLVCDVSRQNKYQKHCDVINKISATKLMTSTPEERDMFFGSLRTLMSYKQKVVKKALTTDKNRQNTKHHKYPFKDVPHINM